MYRLLIFSILLTLNPDFYAQNTFLFDATKVQVAPININTDESEFGPFVIANTFYYTSSQERKIGVINMEAGTHHQMLDLYTGSFTDSIRVSKVKPLSDIINNPLNQGGCFFDRVSSKLFYASDIESGLSTKKYKLAIFSSEWNGNEFLTPKPELVLADTFSAAHPIILGNRLYFSSNMTGGKGKTDIYYAEKLPDSWDNTKKWGNFKNCEFLNSAENEFFPFVINENEIYFSSNRAGGFGGLDLYKYTSAGNTIQNLGEPINSKYDDFSLYMDSLQEKGYFSSNREEFQDDIYYFRQTWPSFTNCKEAVPEDYCYNLSEESTLNSNEAKGYYYEWLFGDGTRQKGLNVRHCFPGPGNYQINLNIIDSLTKSVFMSQATFDLKIDSITQLKINCLDTVLAGKAFSINSIGTYLPENKIHGYYYEIEKTKVKGASTKYSFSKPGTYSILLGVITTNTKTQKRELICTTKKVVCADNPAWAAIEERRIEKELAQFAYRAFKADSISIHSIPADSDIELYNKMGLNGKKIVSRARILVGERKGKGIIDAIEPGQTQFAYKTLKGGVDTLLYIHEGDDVTFKVHFGTSKTIKDTTLLNSKGIVGISEKRIADEFHYTYGNEKKLEDIEKYYQRALNAGVKASIVIGYKNDVIMLDQSKNIKPATFEENPMKRSKDTTAAVAVEKNATPKDSIVKPIETIANSTEEKKPETEIKETTLNTSKPETINEPVVAADTKAEAKKETVSTPEETKTETKTDVTSNTTEENSKKPEPVKKETRRTTKKETPATSSEPAVSSKESIEVTNESEFNSLTNAQKKTQEFLEKYGDISVKDLEFRVQVGVFRKRRSYSFPKLKGMGKIRNEHLSNGTTRMTIGRSFNTLSEAFKYNKDIIKAGHEDAFVSVYYKGKRIYIENLERRGVLTSENSSSKEKSIDEATLAKQKLNNEPEIESIEESNADPNITHSYSNDTEFRARTNIQKKMVMYAGKYGNISADGLEFKVQIAVFKYRKNYDFPKLQEFGPIETESLGNGVVRVTIGGNFKTLGEAFELTKKVVKAGQTDAFVSVFYKGKRIYIENLEQKGVFVVNKN